MNSPGVLPVLSSSVGGCSDPTPTKVASNDVFVGGMNSKRSASLSESLSIAPSLPISLPVQM